MSLCIACGKKPNKCECFGEKPKPKLHRYNDKKEATEPLPEVEIHGLSAYAKYGCRCTVCRTSASEYRMKKLQAGA